MMTKANLKLISDIPADGEYHALGFNTKGIRFHNTNWHVWYYDTLIIQVTDLGVILNAGEYRSDTTMERMNFYLEPLGIQVIVKDDEWFVVYMDTKDTCLFMDQMVIGGPDHTFNLGNCDFATDLEVGRDDLLNYLDEEVQKYGVIPDIYSHDIAEALKYINPDMAVLSISHVVILSAFKKLCRVRLPDVAHIIQKYEVKE